MLPVYNLVDVVIAFLIDLILGDPHNFPHPVRYIGRTVSKFELFLRNVIKNWSPERKERNELIAGIILTASVIIVTFLTVFLLLKIATLIHPVLFHALNIYFIYSAIATKCLADEAWKVYDSLAGGNLAQARERLSMLVGRETANLKEEEVVRGAIETTAENTVDGVISPLFYAIIGSDFGMGAPLAWIFKAISTMDSMVGYMNDKYIYFGRAAARADDAANYIPARLSGILIPVAAFICRMDYIKSFKIMKRDRKNHKSPNCAWPEAAFAGALGIRIGGSNVYFGQFVEKPTIGDAVRPIDKDDIPGTIKLMYATAAVTIIAGIVVYMLILFL